MFADVALPPTFVFDWIYLGPMGLFAFSFVVMGLIILFVDMTRRGISKVRVILLCAFLFVTCDCVVYVASGWVRGERRRPPPPYHTHVLSEMSPEERLRLSPAQESAIKDTSNRY